MNMTACNNSLPLTASPSGFTLRELNRVGAAAAMMVVAGSIVIISMTMALGHYNSLAHSGPKAVVDGLTIALLMGKLCRWRCLALLGVVYGLVLMLQVGVVYLLGVMIVAGVVAALVGRITSGLHRFTAVCLAAVTFELLAGCGAPVKIWLATRHGDEPFLWMMWFAEWPLRIIGALVGVVLARRWLARQASAPAVQVTPEPTPIATDSRGAGALAKHHGGSRRKPVRGRGQAGLRLGMAMVACAVPMFLESWLMLGSAALLFFAYGWWAGLRKELVGVLIGLLWGTLVFAAASFLWHQDKARVLDLIRTFTLGMTPLAVSAPVLILTSRPVDLIGVLRRCRVPNVVLIPVAQIAREVPRARQRMAQDLKQLREQGVELKPATLFRQRMRLPRRLLASQVQHWMISLSRE